HKYILIFKNQISMHNYSIYFPCVTASLLSQQLKLTFLQLAYKKYRGIVYAMDNKSNSDPSF
ncbi:hypothetical protein, partial [Enterobacter hormaechei]|uniref:hypothetical protein n=1 Tax=Enterobacter hormaechei TaxID=158836 RepID=UPI0000E1B544